MRRVCKIPFQILKYLIRPSCDVKKSNCPNIGFEVWKLFETEKEAEKDKQCWR